MGESFEAERRRAREELDRQQEELSFMATHDRSPACHMLGRSRRKIERHQELAILREQHCSGGQGFLSARPLDATKAQEFLAKDDSARPSRGAAA